MTGSLEEILTGPIARGQSSIVEAQKKELLWDSDLYSCMNSLSNWRQANDQPSRVDTSC